ncbi:hypothetical protein SAMN05444487_10714 [Marininema mesophilum]|uniref:DUF7916 domain-containing protein n=1 Tax=Marininema mesophilum TaxID=1048340 RepID=A0A1H2WY18_9BACL|nr:haloacid dehalogenase-like hydrolase [Marininema mesophilum]SDW85510.1 hypothetical protein SAMN05444487_10714 [Marininema mesophilum]
MADQRLIDATPAEMTNMKGRELLLSIQASEGRTVVAETVAPFLPLVDGCSNCEIATAFGADLLLLNKYDVQNPCVGGFPSRSGALSDNKGLLADYEQMLGIGVTAGEVTRFVGRPVGVNLEPVEKEVSTSEVALGRRATPMNGEKAMEQGARFLVLTGNPRTGITTEAITTQIKALRGALGPEIILMAGKMHGTGVNPSNRDWLTEKELEGFIEHGADVILLPLPGSVPGISVAMVNKWVRMCHERGALTMLTLGTSQESSSQGVIERLAIDGKMAGGDLFHIGDAGFSGIALPENIHAYSISLKGRRHTYRRMAQSHYR